MQQEAVTSAARRNLAPIPMECDAPFLKVQGELPRELNGTLYRNGPNPQFEAPGAHWFVGDGMLHAFHLENGRASYRNRWLRPPKSNLARSTGLATATIRAASPAPSPPIPRSIRSPARWCSSAIMPLAR